MFDRLRFSGAALRPRPWRFGLYAMFAAWLAGCAGVASQQYRPGERAVSADPDGRFTLHYVEADDEGWFWEPKQALDAQAAIEKSAAERDTIVLLFVHGWHHTAECCDGNVEGFKYTLGQLDEELRKPMYRAARSLLGGGAHDVAIVGVYIGWRGRSLPGVLDYATFWDRKAGASRVGSSDVREFVERLGKFHASRAQHLEQARRQAQVAAGAPAAPQPPQHLFGLVTIGHSFGGQVVLDAVAQHLEDRLIEAGAPPAYLRDTREPRAQVSLDAPIGGFGDLVLLVNPATEAAAYQRLHALALSVRPAADQAPLLLTVSANDDGPRKTAFKLGRIAGEVIGGKPHKADPFERDSERLALGFFDAQVTHTLSASDKTLKLKQTQQAGAPESYCAVDASHCTFDIYAWAQPPAQPEPDSLTAGDASRATLHKIDCHDLSQRTVFGDVVLAPKPGGAAAPNQMFLVAAAESNVITGHNGMFSAPLLEFLTKYIGFIEAKRFMRFVVPQRDCP